MRNLNIKLYLTSVGLIFLNMHLLLAQEMPPVPASISVVSQMDFGRIVIGNGTVTVPNDGSAGYTSGSVFLMPNSIVHPALFTVESNPGQVLRVNLNNGSGFNLTGNNGGNKSCTLSNAFINGMQVSHNQVFITQSGSQYTDIYIGGELEVNTNEPVGSYSGEFYITIIME